MLQIVSNKPGNGSNDYRFDTLTKFFDEWGPPVGLG